MADTTPTPKLNVLVFSAALRAESLNRALAAFAARVAENHGATVDLASMRDFDVPLYDGDVEKANGIPPGAREFRRRLLANDVTLLRKPFTAEKLVRRAREALDGRAA